MAWEEFIWCLGVVNKPIEEAAKKAAEQRKAEEAALAAKANEEAEAEAEAEANVETEEVVVEKTEE